MKSTRLLTSYVLSKWPIYIIAALSISCGNIIQSYYPKLLGLFTDKMQQGELTKSLIIHYSVELLVIGVSFGLLTAVGQYLIMRMGRRFEFMGALSIVAEGRTSIIIAHRLSTVMQANRIIVMSQGNIVEEGNHDELLALHGYYEQLYLHSQGAVTLVKDEDAASSLTKFIS